jgi:hypothetical protein
MPKYRVQIDAKNFLLNLDGATAKYGFITYRVVDAPDPAAAENSAVQMIRDDHELRDLVLNEKNDPPVMDVEEIVEVETVDDASQGQPGRVWYGMNPKKWWQFWRR